MIEMNEDRKWIKGFEGRYYVTKDSEVFSVLRKGEPYRMVGAVMYDKSRDSKTYRLLCLTADDGVASSLYLHRIVAEAFIPNPENKPEVNHKDGNKLNNKLDNLEWATRSENTIHMYEMGLCPAPVRDEDYRIYLTDRFITYRDTCGYVESTIRKLCTKEDFQRNGVPYDLFYLSQSLGRSYKEVWQNILVIFALNRNGVSSKAIGDLLGLSYNSVYTIITRRERSKELNQIYDKYINSPEYTLRHVVKIREAYNGKLPKSMRLCIQGLGN